MARRRSEEAEAMESVAEESVLVEPVAETRCRDDAADQEEIARLAYSYWESRGRQGGSPADDWFRAEEEVKTRRAAAANPQA